MDSSPNDPPQVSTDPLITRLLKAQAAALEKRIEKEGPLKPPDLAAFTELWEKSQRSLVSVEEFELMKRNFADLMRIVQDQKMLLSALQAKSGLKFERLGQVQSVV